MNGLGVTATIDLPISQDLLVLLCIFANYCVEESEGAGHICKLLIMQHAASTSPNGYTTFIYAK